MTGERLGDFGNFTLNADFGVGSILLVNFNPLLLRGNVELVGLNMVNLAAQAEVTEDEETQKLENAQNAITEN